MDNYGYHVKQNQAIYLKWANNWAVKAELQMPQMPTKHDINEIAFFFAQLLIPFEMF